VVELSPAKFPCPAVDLQLTGDHLRVLMLKTSMEV